MVITNFLKILHSEGTVPVPPGRPSAEAMIGVLPFQEIF